MKRIAIQGLIGSFHDIAAHLYFEGEQIQLICCSTFEQVFDSIKQDPTAIGMLAIENTIAGSLLHNYELLIMNCCVILVRRWWASISCTLPTASVVCLRMTGTPSRRSIPIPWP